MEVVEKIAITRYRSAANYESISVVIPYIFFMIFQILHRIIIGAS